MTEEQKEKNRARARKWARDNPERNRARARAWYQANSKRALAREAARHATNPDPMNARSRAYREANPGAAAAYREENREKLREQSAQWRRDNPERHAYNSRLYEARKRSAATGPPFTLSDVIERDGTTCHLCGEECQLEDRTVDHVIPLARGGAHSLDNCALAHMVCNARKGAR